MGCINQHKVKERLAIQLPSYKPLSILIRFVVISVIAIGILHLINATIDSPALSEQKIPLIFYVIIIVTFNAASELQIALDNLLERFFPIPEKLKLRVIIQFTFGILLLIVAHRVVMFTIEPKLPSAEAKPGIYLGLVSGLFFVYVVANSLTVARFTQKWMDSQEEIAEMKREKLRMDYNSLQDQLNPHFLFNNLSVLKSLIIYDKDSAVQFIENFTDVYRYVLQSKNILLTNLSDEMEFIRSYIGLHKERLGEGLQVVYSIADDDLNKDISPLTLQLLVENAIKHNIASRENPLKIELKTENGYVSVANNLQARASSYSTKTGLKNLISRYEMLSQNKIEISEETYNFKVSVPLL